MEKNRIDIDAAALGSYWKNELPHPEYLIAPPVGRRLAFGLLVFLGVVTVVCGILAGFIGYETL
ncbi:MAG: hypothetical protein JO068_21145 [Hyphomicrobiales bacterium]|nr:hypothetical protein [Hyphomicrobiales bacterium]